MKPTRITAVGMGVLILCLMIWLLLTLIGDGQTKTGPSQTDDKHCPACGRELPATALSSDDCPYCKLENNAGGGQAKPSGGTAARPNIAVGACLSVAFVFLLGLHIFLALRRRTSKYTDETLYHTSCTNCARRLRYKPKQIGHAAQCPLCRRMLVFPKPDKAPHRRLWQKITQW
jgi:hypothetical protein